MAESDGNPGAVFEMDDVDQGLAEQLLARADSAVFFPDLGRMRWLERAGATPFALPEGRRRLGGSSTAGFLEEVERDYPNFRLDAHGRYLMKVPVRGGPVLPERTGRTGQTAQLATSPTGPTGPVAPASVVFSEGFEEGLGSWDLSNDSLDLYGWGTTTCDARSGARSADAVRNGQNGLDCTSAYGPNSLTMMMHRSCEGLAGAQQAWLDLYIRTSMADGESLNVGYADASNTFVGWGFAGSWNSWTRIVFNLRNLNGLDVTTLPCPRVVVYFLSDASTQGGYGARVDDLAIRTDPPSFLSASVTAVPASGTAPLTVAFTATVTGAGSGATFDWRFRDPAGSTSTSKDTTFTYTQAGDYTPRFRVVDGSNQAYAWAKVHVDPPGTCSLSCSATAPATGTAGVPVSFGATATASGCSGSPAWSWNFGNGQGSNAQNPSATYANAGTYSWSVTASIAGASPCTRSGAIVVSSGGSRIPGDCNGDGRVTIDEVQRALNMLTKVEPPGCGVDVNGDGKVTIDEVQRVVNAFLTPLPATTIGPAGGVVRYGGLTLTIPPGALAANAVITAGPSTDAHPFGAYAAGAGVSITGLPASFSLPITISVRHDGTVTGNAHLGVGLPMISKSDDATRHHFLIPATEANGVLTGVLRPPSPQQKAGLGRTVLVDFANDSLGFDVRPVKTHVTLLCPSKRFEITLPKDLKVVKGVDLCTVLDAAYDTDKGPVGFGTIDTKRAKWPPLPVSAAGDPTDYMAKASYGYYGWWESMNLSPYDLVNTVNATRTGAFHETMHMFQSFHGTTTFGYLWIDEATATWVEELGALDPLKLQPLIEENRSEALHYLPSGWTPWNWRYHGYGIAGLIKHLVGKYGANIVSSIYEGVAAGKLDASAVILGAVLTRDPSVGADEAWKRYVTDHLAGFAAGAYGAPGTDFVKIPTTKKATLTFYVGAKDVTTAFQESYSGPSVKLFYFPLLVPVHDPSADYSVCFGVDDGLVAVFEVPSSGNLVPLSTWSQKARVDDAAALSGRGSHLLAAVLSTQTASPYTGSRTITLSTGDCGPPTIVSLTPDKGPPGTAVTIAGTLFGSQKGSSTVTFNGVLATVDSWSNGRIGAKVPDTATTGSVVVTVGGVKSNGKPFTVEPPEVVVKVLPASVTLLPGGSQPFTATVTGTSNTAVDWKVAEGTYGGTITSAGTYTAPQLTGTYHVVATSRADPTRSGTGLVTVASSLPCVPESKFPASGRAANWNGRLAIEYDVQGLAISDYTDSLRDLGGFPTGSQVTVSFKVFGPYSIQGSWSTGGAVTLNGVETERYRAPDKGGEAGWTFSPKPVTVTITDEVRRKGFSVGASVSYATGTSASDVFVTVRGKACP